MQTPPPDIRPAFTQVYAYFFHTFYEFSERLWLYGSSIPNETPTNALARRLIYYNMLYCAFFQCSKVYSAISSIHESLNGVIGDVTGSGHVGLEGVESLYLSVYASQMARDLAPEPETFWQYGPLATSGDLLYIPYFDVATGTLGFLTRSVFLTLCADGPNRISDVPFSLVGEKLLSLCEFTLPNALNGGVINAGIAAGLPAASDSGCVAAIYSLLTFQVVLRELSAYDPNASADPFGMKENTAAILGALAGVPTNDGFSPVFVEGLQAPKSLSHTVSVVFETINDAGGGIFISPTQSGFFACPPADGTLIRSRAPSPETSAGADMIA